MYVGILNRPEMSDHWMLFPPKRHPCPIDYLVCNVSTILQFSEAEIEGPKRNETLSDQELRIQGQQEMSKALSHFLVGTMDGVWW